MALIRLYQDNAPAVSATEAPKTAGPIRLYSDSAAPATSPAPAATEPKPFQGGGFGASNIKDTSGKSLLTYQDQSKQSSVLDTTRVATTFDPRVPQKLDPDTFHNPRAVENRAALKQMMGGTYSDELDHGIALELGGSNKTSNLRPERLVSGTKNTATDPLENSLAKDVASGKKSLFQAQTELAKAKGIAQPFTGDTSTPATDGAPAKPKTFLDNVNDLRRHFSSLADKGLYAVGNFAVNAVRHPNDLLDGIVESAILKPLDWASQTLSGDKTTSYKNSPAFKDVSVGKEPTDPGAKVARSVGNFLGWMAPYSEVAKGTEAALTGTALAANIPAHVAKYIPAISEAAGFLGTGQILHDKEDGSRWVQAKNDLLNLALFKTGGFLFGRLQTALSPESTKALDGAVGPVIDKLKSGQSVSLDEAEAAAQKGKTIIASGTGESPKDLVWNHLNEDVPKKDFAAQAGFANPGEIGAGLKETAKANVEDVSKIGRGAKEVAGEIKGGFSPQTASPEAQAAADEVRQAKAKIANLSAIESSKYSNVAKGFRSFSDAENIGNISEYERTGTFKKAPAGYSEFYQKSMDESRGMLRDAYGQDRVGYVENYVRRAFVFGSKADEEKGTSYLTNKLNSLSANKSPTRGRVLDMPLDEALADMRGRGIKVKPATTNPEELRQWSVANARQAVAYKETWTALKDGGLVQFVKQGDHAPDGLVALSDRAAKVFYPTDKGLVQGGTYYADKNVARVLNNAISRGLGDSATFRGVRAINNAMNQVQLGLSGFHFTGTAINAGISDLALGVRQLARGDLKAGGASLGRSVVPLASFARDVFKGNKLIQGLKENSPDAYRFLEEKLNPAGGRLNVDARYRNKAYENMVTAFKNRNIVGAAVRLPLAVVEQTAKPLMEFSIPRVKIGAFMDLAEDITKRMPNASDAEMRRALANGWDSVDNRFGQLTYDNLFWNKTATDLAQISTRSVGWNLGTVRELGGGLTDLRKIPKGEVSDRLLYTAALPVYVGMIGAVYQYLHTGKGPQELKDYFYPKNGLTDASGNPDRTTLPTYMKDVYAYTQHPVQTVLHKQSPLLDYAITLGRNQNYFGDMIRNPNDPISKQLQQVGAYTLQSIQPFSVQQFQKVSGEGANLERKAESFGGFVKAPGDIVKSDKQKQVEALMPTRGPRTPEQVQTDTMKTKARQEIRQGKFDTLNQLVKQGVVKDRSRFIRDAKLPTIQREMKTIPKAERAKLK